MKKFILLMVSLVLACGVMSARTEKYAIPFSGWGRLEIRSKTNGISAIDPKVSELDIHRWRKAGGELDLDLDGKLVTVRLPRKEITYNLLTESYVHKANDGWSYVEYLALENDHTFCRVWVCTHEGGDKQFLVLYPTFVQGYKLAPAE